MDCKTIVVITGGNQGLGFQTAKSLLNSERSYHILVGGRDSGKALKAVDELSRENGPGGSICESFQVDVESDESIQQAYGYIAERFPRIDVLVNNAGASFDGKVEAGLMTAREGWNRAWDVNVTGAHIMTTTFLPLLLKSKDPRLLFITSGLSSLSEAKAGDPRYPPPPAGLPKTQLFMSYRSAKTGLNMLMLEWSRSLRNDNVKVWAIAPGLLATGLGQNQDLLKQLGAVEPSVGGTVVKNVIEGKRDAETGLVVREYKTPTQPW